MSASVSTAGLYAMGQQQAPAAPAADSWVCPSCGKTVTGKFCTEYGIAATAARMVHIVLHDEKTVMPASAELQGEYGEEGLFVGVPCMIGKNGVEEVIELPLTEEERARFHECCEGVRKNMEHLKDID